MGYVADEGCRACHEERYDAYQHVGMARSFVSTSNVSFIETFDSSYYHAPSQRYYQLRREGEGLIFKRWMLDSLGSPIHELELTVDWVLGSGNRARSYLYQTEWGELYELPVGWYSESEKWGMSPGFEGPQHFGVQRRVTRECMFCHNAFPEVAAETDRRWKPHLFPDELPEGTGCQRCHGPGADHIRSARGGGSFEQSRSLITNPENLPNDERDSVCFQCHLLPSVSMAGARRFDRADYSFRPGEPLSEYLLPIETQAPEETPGDRFEINHHGYRFWSSVCYQQSKGALSCLSCHDVHQKPQSDEFRAEVASVCLSCHGEIEVIHQTVATDLDAGCVECHMPTRRARDVVLTTMTDHRIARGPFDLDALVAPIAKESVNISGMSLLPFGDLPENWEGELYRVVAAVRNHPRRDSVAALARLLEEVEIDSPLPLLDLAEGQLKTHEFEAAEQNALRILDQFPDLLAARKVVGMVQVATGRHEEAITTLSAVLQQESSPEVHFNLALGAVLAENPQLALEHLDEAIKLREIMSKAWQYKGRVLHHLERPTEAREALIRALALEPNDTASYVALVVVLRSLGEYSEADRYLAVGRRVVPRPEVLNAL